MIKILIADDHAVVRFGLRRLLCDEPDMEVTGEAETGAEAIEMVRNNRYDVVLLDINMNGRNGLDVLQSIRAIAGAPPVLMLSMYPEQQYALIAMKQGARGYVPKYAQPGEVVVAVRRVVAGGHYLTATGASLVQAQVRGLDDRTPHQRLSPREHQIMLLLIRGRSLTEIGRELLVSVKTVSTHRTHILAKLGLDSNAALVMYAMRQGLVH